MKSLMENRLTKHYIGVYDIRICLHDGGVIYFFGVHGVLYSTGSVLISQQAFFGICMPRLGLNYCHLTEFIRLCIRKHSVRYLYIARV